jgi:translation initiation factor IF-1
MVKNTKGGNKSKAIARKHMSGAKDSHTLRLSTSCFEQFGVVTRVLGNGMFYVVTDMHPQLLGHIRNKFRGRSKRDNSISIGSLVLIGLREWEQPNFKNGDLLEVYDSNEVRQIINIPNFDLSLFNILESFQSNSNAIDSTNDIQFNEEFNASSEITQQNTLTLQDSVCPDDL